MAESGEASGTTAMPSGITSASSRLLSRWNLKKTAYSKAASTKPTSKVMSPKFPLCLGTRPT